MTDVLNFLKPELSLLGVDSDIEFAQSREDLANIREEGTRVTPVDEDVIYVKLANVVDYIVSLSRLCSTCCVGSRGRNPSIPWPL